MATLTRYPSVKRFGVRYGRRLKEQVGKIEKSRRDNETCPLCRKTALKRIAAGIWSCSKCNVKMAGGAHIPNKMARETAEVSA